MMFFRLALCLSLLLACGCAARRASRIPRPVIVQPDRTAAQPYAAYYGAEAGMIAPPTYEAASNPGVFGRLMEMERRKNAWLRRTFLGE